MPFDADKTFEALAPAEQAAVSAIGNVVRIFCGEPFMGETEETGPEQICGVREDVHDAFYDDDEHEFLSIADALERVRDMTYRAISEAN